MKRITTYETYGETFADDNVAMCYEGTMILRDMMFSEDDKVLFTEAQCNIILDLIISRYDQYKVPILPIINEWKSGELDFNNLTISQIREYVENKTDEVA